VTNALNSMGSGVATKITEVSGFFSALATQLGLTYNDANLNTAVITLTPVPYSPPTLASSWKAMPGGGANSWAWDYLATGTRYYMDASLTPVYAQGEWWIPLSGYNGVYAWKGITSNNQFPTPPQHGKGGLTSGLSIAGEIGPEWVVPTYEPERSRFLNTAPPAFWSNMGVSGGGEPEAIARALAAQIRPLVAALASSGAGGELHIHLNVDGRELANVMAGQYRQGHKDLIEQTRRRIQ
jgi:hypothetical protein